MPQSFLDRRPYRHGVGVVLLNKDKKVFVGKRINDVEMPWQMPQGGIDKDESPDDAVLRELKEEVGTCNTEIIASSDWLSYDLPRSISRRLWRGKFRGQRQKWYLMRFLGDDSEIDINHSEYPEFRDWKWVSPQEIEELIVFFKKRLYRKILEIFAEHL